MNKLATEMQGSEMRGSRFRTALALTFVVLLAALGTATPAAAAPAPTNPQDVTWANLSTLPPTPAEPVGSISACKFDDANANGVQDADEPSISDWQMSVYAGSVEQGEQPIASGGTGEGGFVNFEQLLPGQYTVCEGEIEGWLPTIGLCQIVTVVSEQETSVTFGNVRGGRILVEKVTDPTGASDAFSFLLSKGETSVNFSLTDSGAPFDSGLLFPGVCSIAESAAEGWTLTDVTCVSAHEEDVVSELPNPVTINLQAGQLVWCTFTNTQDAPPTETATPEPSPSETPQPTPSETPSETPQPVGSLTVIKLVIWNDVAVTPTTFTLCIQGASFPTGAESDACSTFDEAGGSHTWPSLTPGVYTVTEINVDTEHWVVEGSGGSVEVVADAEATYTVTNIVADVEGEGDPPTSLDPVDEPGVNVTQYIFFPTVLR